MESVKPKAAAPLHPPGSRPVKIGNCVIGFVKEGKRAAKAWALPGQRLHEIEEVIRSRHGSFVDDDDAISYLAPLAAAVANERRAAIRKEGREPDDAEITRAVISACRRWLPSLPMEEIEEEACDAVENPRLEKADVIGKALGVSFAERQALGLKTIGCRDLNKRQRKAAVKAIKVERQKAKRRASGVKPRQEYEGNSVRALAASWGVSRQTIYDWRKRGDPRGFDRCEAHISQSILASDLSSSAKNDSTRGDVAGASSPEGHVTQAASKSIRTATRDVRSALNGPAPSHALPIRISHPEMYSAVFLPMAAGLKADPIGKLLRIASSALRHHPAAANINHTHAALASIGRA